MTNEEQRQMAKGMKAELSEWLEKGRHTWEEVMEASRISFSLSMAEKRLRNDPALVMGDEEVRSMRLSVYRFMGDPRAAD